ncbi:unnamed protein product [Malus baccata var. baccata]
MDIHGGSGGLVGNKEYSIFFFLRKVLRKVLLEDRSFHKLLVIAVFLEFVNCFHILDKWPTTPFTLSFTYTMPEILKNRSNCVYVFGFQKVRNCVYVFGSLIGSGSGSYWDEIVLPLAIDLCANACVPAPPSFMQLPSELQMKILEVVARCGYCHGELCKELRDLADDDDLWKQKVFDELLLSFFLIKPKAISVFNNDGEVFYK